MERLHRCWSQLEVVDQLGPPGNVSRWERSLTSPGPYFRSKLCELFGRSAQELGLTWEESADLLGQNLHASALTISSAWNGPCQYILFFAGREDLLMQLHTLLRERTMAVLLVV